MNRTWVLLAMFSALSAHAGRVQSIEGTWGAPGFVKASFTDGYGTSSEFKFSAPDDASTTKPKGVIVYLHGDGASDYESKMYWNQLVREANAHGVMVLSVKSPPSVSKDCADPNGRCWWLNAERNSRFLLSVLNSVESQYGLDRSRTLFTGQSGGPTFLGGHFLPKYGKGFGGGALLACAGYLNTLQQGLENGPDPKNFKIDIVTGDADYLRTFKQAGVDEVYRKYLAAGHSDISYVSEPAAYRRYTDGKVRPYLGGHCQFKNGYASYLQKTAKRVFGGESSPFTAMAGLSPPQHVPNNLVMAELPPTSPIFVANGEEELSSHSDTGTVSRQSAVSGAHENSKVNTRVRDVAPSRPVAAIASTEEPRRGLFGRPAFLRFRPFRLLGKLFGR